MAQTRTITRKKKAAFRVLDWAVRPLHLTWRPPPPRTGEPRSFLIVEPWGIGDVILATPLLASLRDAFPSASITLLAKPYARELLEQSQLVDETIGFDFPWTAFTQKYSPSRYQVGAFEQLFRDLRRRDFDVSLDARRDIRSNLVAYLSGARRRIGYDFGGGSHLLTDVLPSGDQNAHKIEDWLALLGPLGVQHPSTRQPRLAVTLHERTMARARLRGLGIRSGTPVVGLHPGASHVVRRWEQNRFATVIEQIARAGRAQFLVFEEREGDSRGIATERPIPRVRGGLREMMAFIAECDLFLCNDSGPMHIAEALGVPVTALFGGSRVDWYGPRGEFHETINVEVMPCRPCFDACIFSSAICMEGISSDRVVTSLLRQLDRINARRIDRATASGEI